MTQTDEPAPAHDPHAEFCLLATLIDATPDIRRRAWNAVDPAEFYHPTYATLARIIADLDHIDPALVAAAIRRHHEPQQVDAMLRLLPALVTDETHFAEHAELYAASIRSCARRRALTQLGQRIIQQATSPTSNVDDLIIGTIEGAEGMITGVSRFTEPASTVDEFLHQEITHDWLIPGLLERYDRMMLTGGEGHGKSVLTRQIGVCVSAGVHPFTAARFDPINVLIVDLENPRGLIQRMLRPLVAAAKAHGDYTPERLRIESKPAGIDLSELADAAWFTDKIAASNPDLLIVGPLYRTHSLPLDKEDAARAVTVIFDQIRSRQQCAVILEAHAGHGWAGHRSWRPTGSSLFMRWPEFGFGLTTDFDTWTATLRPWRGSRDEREWPTMLRRGNRGNFPWLETIPEAENSRWRTA